ncbi:MAG: 4Fe-4S binding protein [Candidatus Marinimicrobia bacterium]|nr:4Fe-4S binding protein [Candidatus Neomarinimicrobiota bacterium]
MRRYFSDIWLAITTLLTGMGVTIRHFIRARKGIVTLQYPIEKWPRPERYIGFNHDNYNVIRSSLYVDIDDCIGCGQCVRACPVSCIKIETMKVNKGEDIPAANHIGITSKGSMKRFLLTRFDIDMSECCYCNLCTYPCPEDCIFMTGGPNSNRHELDYEFSVHDRNELIYHFSKVPAVEVERRKRELERQEKEKGEK